MALPHEDVGTKNISKNQNLPPHQSLLCSLCNEVPCNPDYRQVSVCAKHFKNEDFKFFVGEKDMRGRIRTTCKLKENAVPSLYLSGDIPVIKDMLLRRTEVKGSVLALKDIKKENLENSSDNIEPGNAIYDEDFEQLPSESEEHKVDSKLYFSKIQSPLQSDQNVKHGQSWQTGFLKFALGDRNMQVRFCLKMALKFLHFILISSDGDTI